MVLQWYPPVRLFESGGLNNKVAKETNAVHFLEVVEESCSSRFQRFQVIGRSRFSCSSVPGISLRRWGRAWTVSSLSSPQIRSAAYNSAPESVVVSRPWETRAIEGNDSVQTEKSIQQQKLLIEENEIRKDWKSRWESNVQRKVDYERPPADSRHYHGDEKLSGRDDPPEKYEQSQENGDGTYSQSRSDGHRYRESQLADEETSLDSLEGGHGEIDSSFQLDTDYNSATQEIAFREEVLRGNQSTPEALEEDVRRNEQEFSVVTIPGSATLNLEREMELGVSAVQLACLLSQRTQQRLLHLEERADEKKDRSLVTVAGADWGVQAVVSWVLSQGEALIPMIAEEDTKDLKGRDKMGLLQRVVDAVNQCLQEAPILGICPPARPLGAMDVLKAIGKGSAEGGKKGRYWVLDPIDGTLGFVRGDQYAIALALLEDGEVVLAVLGCPNFPLRKQWLRYHHRYYRLASKLLPPSPGKWHKGVVLTTTKGAGQVMMRPLVVDPDGVPQVQLGTQMPQPISVSPIDDPAKATFCEPFEKSNSSHSFTAGLAQSIGLRNHPLRVYSLAKYAAIARGDAEIFMKFAKSGYKEKIWDHAAGVLIVQEAGGVVTDAAGRPLDFSQGRLLEHLDRGIIACSGKTLHEQLLKAVDASWNSSRL